jgi:hypothetical protein
MELWNKIFTILKNLLGNLENALTKISSPGIDWNRKSSKESLSVEMGKNGNCFKIKIKHEKSDCTFHIGILVKKDKDKEKLFFSFDEAHILAHYKYPQALPLCSPKESGNDEAEAWFVVADPYNEEFFNAETTETRKEEIIAQILTGVIETLEE